MIGHHLTDAFDGVSLESGAIATMRDGTRLIADIYRPTDGTGPWPVLLMRQPYGRDIASTVVYAHPTWWAREGFLVIIQDVRGRGDSEGTFYTFRNEIDDGADTVAWAAALPGSNGRVGMYGFSYQASTQLLAALARPPALKALAPHMTAFDLYSGWFYRDGILQLSTTIGWASQMLREDARRTEADSAAALDTNWLNAGRLSSAMPLTDAPPLANEDVPSYGIDWIRHPTKDAYWEEFDLLARVAELAVPMFHLSGWYDFYLRGSVDGFRKMAATHPGQVLLAGPWQHIPWGEHVGGQDLGPAAAPAIDAMMAAWFHHWLDHEVPVGAAPLPPVRYFELGSNAWKEATAWPPPASQPREWFLCSGKRANSRYGDGALSPDGPAGPEDMFTYDPEVPVVAPGGNRGGNVAFGPHDLAPQQEGNNLLVYTSSPLDTPLVIAGDPRCVLHVCSSASHTHFVVRLSRVLPTGVAQFLCLGAASVIGADTPTGKEISIQLDPIAVQMAPGETVRIDVASSAYPLLIRSPNHATDPATVKAPGDFGHALQVVYHNDAQPSRLVLPVLTD
ncbi:CocE/NonD family hydrolase [Synoicihabitans lomoniglobus]|uniref:CocE/NonD family hydrolase n=1 Tax=Synoicihabitans lomoniglobus TaxID=2909285 RepID=A0AAF0I7B4_9BACT|nr:CocE/NonD family hydrolase [Opitutaceae bacterium LMO-M01]WED66616.1 CocE/NonD family hydrolase [Opitutaceae bacterium LMO-M01]